MIKQAMDKVGKLPDIEDMDSVGLGRLLSSNNTFLRILAENELKRRERIADSFGC